MRNRPRYRTSEMTNSAIALHQRSASSARDEAQRAQTRKKEICPATHRDKARQSAQPSKSVRRLTRRKWFAVAKQRIGFTGQCIELRIGQPGVLNELELPRDVGIQTDEVQPALRRRRCIGQRSLLGWHRSAIFTATAQDAMEPAGGNGVVTQVVATGKAEHPDRLRKHPLHAAGHVPGARVGTAYMRAERADAAVWIGVIGEAVL